jgi:hypothetical protein
MDRYFVGDVLNVKEIPLVFFHRVQEDDHDPHQQQIVGYAKDGSDYCYLQLGLDPYHYRDHPQGSGLSQ